MQNASSGARLSASQASPGPTGPVAVPSMKWRSPVTCGSPPPCREGAPEAQGWAAPCPGCRNTGRLRTRATTSRARAPPDTRCPARSRRCAAVKGRSPRSNAGCRALPPSRPAALSHHRAVAHGLRSPHPPLPARLRPGAGPVHWPQPAPAAARRARLPGPGCRPAAAGPAAVAPPGRSRGPGKIVINHLRRPLRDADQRRGIQRTKPAVVAKARDRDTAADEPGGTTDVRSAVPLRDPALRAGRVIDAVDPASSSIKCADTFNSVTIGDGPWAASGMSGALYLVCEQAVSIARNTTPWRWMMKHIFSRAAQSAAARASSH